jgi:hypothetical protein
MGVTRRFDIDIDDDQIERGGLPSPGWFGAVVEQVEEVFENNSVKFRFTLTTPAEFAGKVVYDTLWDPSGAKDEEGEKKAEQRQLLYGKRLGLVPPADGPKAHRNFEIDYCNAEGKAVFLRLADRKDGSGFLQVEWGGIYAADDPRVPEKVRNGEPTPLTERALNLKGKGLQAERAERGEKPERAGATAAAKPAAGNASANGPANGPAAANRVEPAADSFDDL